MPLRINHRLRRLSNRNSPMLVLACDSMPHRLRNMLGLIVIVCLHLLLIAHERFLGILFVQIRYIQIIHRLINTMRGLDRVHFGRYAAEFAW